MPFIKKLKMPKKQVSEMSDEELANYQEPGIEEEGFAETAEKFATKGQDTGAMGIAVTPGKLEKSASKLGQIRSKLMRAIPFSPSASGHKQEVMEQMAVLKKHTSKEVQEELNKVLGSGMSKDTINKYISAALKGELDSPDKVRSIQTEITSQLRRGK